MEFSTIIRGIVGILLILSIAFLFSNNKRKINWRLVIIGMVMQLIFAIFIIHGERMGSWLFILEWPKLAVEWLGKAVIQLLVFIGKGSEFVFGVLSYPAGTTGSLGFFFAFNVLPTIIFFAALTSVLYYLGILQTVVKGMAWLMARLLGTSGAESLSNTANVFVGQTEAPILIRPYISSMTQSELYTIMVGGMATVAGGVMASYVQMLGVAMADARGLTLDVAQLRFAVHLITGSVMAAPASLVIAKILYPETKVPKTKGTVKIEVEKGGSNIIESAANGASDGLKLALNVGAMLIVFIAFIYLINFLLGEAGSILGINTWLIGKFGKPLSMELILGFILKYIAIGIGVPVQDSFAFGSLFGTKVVLNEFVAYIGLTDIIKAGTMTDKGITMATFALCGFANFSSIAIQVGGISPMAPERKKDIAALGLKAVLGGSLVTLLTAALAGILIQG
ncbi:MAG TPA: nucleoside transporter C-terminal domain-containing protein [Candidatus Kapabacteria bacterium]|nr:nucleoside transporter C-terminal domain-containing protein [Candidatus Kapabacteria bacterium]